MSHVDNPSFECVTGRHLFFEAFDQAAPRVVIVSWCPWCGTGVLDQDRVTDDGHPIDWTPTYVARIPDGFHRNSADVI